ncbi:hypothetical protein [Asaia bogorensis]|uniref:hypothetical protein n=1 Tax=Asaia bogorensis TaxID=91915 RepID=UPI000EFB9293|nr:hypothetical protein [Asaia bogorensis]
MIGSAVSYIASLCVLALFRHFGSDPLLVVGFLCVFALMPIIVLIVFSLPRRGGRVATGRHVSHAALSVSLPILLALAGMP